MFHLGCLCDEHFREYLMLRFTECILCNNLMPESLTHLELHL